MKWNFFKREKRSNEACKYNDDFKINSMPLLFGKNTAGSPLNLSAVYACMEIISNSIASLPILVSKVDNDGSKISDIEHPLNNVIDNMLYNRFDWMKSMLIDLLLEGNAFTYIKRAADGTVVDLIYIPACDVSIRFFKSTQELYYNVSSLNLSKIEPINMIHLAKNIDHNSYKGRGVLYFGKNIFKLAGMTDSTARKFFQSGCALSGIITTNDPNLLSKAAIDAKNSWQQVYGGNSADQSGVCVLPKGWSYQTISSSANDSQLLETRLFNLTEVCRYFGVSPTLIQDLSKASYNTIEASQLNLVMNTLMPYIKLIETEFNRKLITSKDKGVMIELDENFLLRGDKNSTSNFLQKLVSSGIMTANEARHQLGLAPIAGGDKLVIAYTKIDDNTINKNTDEQNNEEQN